MTAPATLNQPFAEKLRETASLLEAQGANPFRVGAYRRAADTLSKLERDVREIFASEGVEGLLAIPNVGEGIAASLRELLTTGRMSRLERLRGELDAASLFQTLPGIGPKLAQRIHEALHVDTLEALETAAHDGRLEAVEGVGRRRAASIRATLESMLGRVRRPHPARGGPSPDVATLLAVDREYREKAVQDRLPKIAPKRFNPSGEAWLPILHAEHGGWHFTVLFSNTARAHELGRTHDWVVTYFYDGDHREDQHTIVTETRGPLAGRRVIRGREAECRAFYESEIPQRTSNA
jgi:putative hydrolase